MTRYCTQYGAYEIDSVPGQPQLAHCHGFFVAPEHRGTGLGASWHEGRQKWQAQIYINGKAKYLGLFKTKEEAHAAYLAAKRELHPFSTIED